MKIDGGTPLFASATAGVRGKPTSTSFAQLLASGQSVRAIRSERAFGFSETGIFGASRFFEPVKNAAKADAGNNLVSKEPAKLTPNATSSSVGQRRYAAVNMSLSSVQLLSPAHHSQTVLGQTSSFRNASVVNPSPMKFEMTFSGIQKIATSTPPQAAIPWKRAGKRNAELTLSGADDALRISIERSDVESEEAESLHASFFFIAQQYGMILQSVRLNNYYVNSVPSPDSRSR